jgi:PAS domain S-box-containing protein
MKKHNQHTPEVAPDKRRQGEEHYRLLFEHNPQPMWVYDLDTLRFLAVNDAAIHHYGYSREEFLGMTIKEIRPPEDIPALLDMIQRSTGKGLGMSGVWRHRKKDRSLIYVEIVSHPLPFGGRRGKLVVATDITERKQMEKALREVWNTLEMRVHERTAQLQASNQALAEKGEEHRRLFETISDAVFVFDGETRRFVDVNDAALRLYGYTREEFLGLTHLAITAEPEDSETAIQLTLAGAAPRIPLRYHKKKDGTIFPVEISASTFTLRGRPMACGIIRDIAARKQAEEALRRREQELSDFFAESPLGLLWVGPDGRILRVNQAELGLLGRTGEEVFGRHVSELHVDAKAAADVLKRVAKRQTVQNYRARLRHKDGTQREVLIDANGLWEQERLVHSRWFTRDITRRVELEREILAISEREQRRLGHDLHDDLCQQLAGIEFLSQRLASDLAARSAVSAPRAKEIAQMVQRAMTQTRELARGLSPVRLEAEGLTDALRELAIGTRKVFGCDCRFRCDPPVLVPDHTVAIHLYRIAQEAVSNAIKHGQARRIELSVTAKGRSVTLAVKDNGTGIPRKLPKRKGMGLRIMRYRAEVIGGALLVEPVPGGGSRVVCTVTEGLLPAKARNAK